MATELKFWDFNAKKWREKNGFTTKEWIQYKNNLKFVAFVYYIVGLGIGYFVGKVL